MSRYNLVFDRNKFNHVFAVNGFPLVYVNNAKCGCSTIKQSLWLHFDELNEVTTYKGSPHTRKGSPFVKNPEEMLEFLESHNPVFFSMVRNPYSRILSAYLNKIYSDNRDEVVCQAFFKVAGFDSDARPTFYEFLSALKIIPVADQDKHFSPQFCNLLYGVVSYSHLFHIENFPELEAFLKKYNVNIKNWNRHRNDAGEKLSEWFGDSEEELVREIYELDFKLFGYSFDISYVKPVAEMDSILFECGQKYIKSAISKVEGVMREDVILNNKYLEWR